jgi:hypothetical protein
MFCCFQIFSWDISEGAFKTKKMQEWVVTWCICLVGTGIKYNEKNLLSPILRGKATKIRFFV